MRSYLLDIETIPLPENELLALMPPGLANPVMPEHIKNPARPEDLVSFDMEAALKNPPDHAGGCPAYKSKAHPEGDPEKIAAYKTNKEATWKQSLQKQKDRADEKIAAWETDAEAKQAKWEENAIDGRQKFIDDAALSATTGKTKLIGIRDYSTAITYIFVAEATPEEMAKLNAAKYPCQIRFITYAGEMGMLSAFANGVNAGNVVPSNEDNESDFKLVGFYTHLFDLPFLIRRSWITGAMAPISLRKGRYFRDELSCDLYELWQLGDRQLKTGGLDEIAKALGTKRKTGSGERFHYLWASDPVAAVLYLIDDLDVLEEAAERMGAVYTPRNTNPAKN